MSFDGDQRAYDMATDSKGTAFLAWIGADGQAPGSPRAIHLCVLPPSARTCQGGVQTATPKGAPAPAGLRLLVTPSGAVTILGIANVPGATKFLEATASPTGRLGAVTEIGGAPSNGYLLDAEFGPGGSIWTVADSGSGPLQVRDGLSGPAVSVRTPYDVGYARLAFAGSEPIIAVTEAARISQPVAYSSRTGGRWAPFRSVKGTWAAGTDIGLTATSSGVRLVTGIDNSDYSTVVARWTGTGFSAPTPTGTGIATSEHDTSTDLSGRLVDVGDQDASQIIVSNLADTLHAATFALRLPSKETFAGGAPQATTTPRGHGWLAWSYQSASTTHDRLVVAPIQLAALTTSARAGGRHGTVTVTGPASCLPSVATSVGVSGRAAPGWRVSAHHLNLDGHAQGATLQGSYLNAGTIYTLTGTITFTKATAHETVAAELRFRSCPTP